MKKSTKIVMFTVIGVVLIASLILIFAVWLPRLQKDEKIENLEKTLETMAVDYYENEFKKLMPNFLKTNGYLKITLDYLKGIDKDVKIFEDNKCDYNNTYVDIVKDGEENYKTEVYLKCEY